jgi:hypothetical protein
MPLLSVGFIRELDEIFGFGRLTGPAKMIRGAGRKD